MLPRYSITHCYIEDSGRLFVLLVLVLRDSEIYTSTTIASRIQFSRSARASRRDLHSEVRDLAEDCISIDLPRFRSSLTRRRSIHVMYDTPTSQDPEELSANLTSL